MESQWKGEIMFYISEILEKNIWDRWGKEIGRCKDILICSDEQDFPKIIAISIKDKNGDISLIPAGSVSSLYPSIVLKTHAADLTPFSPKGNELYLRYQVLDHQIVDIEGRRVVRVNDIQVAYIQDGYVITGVDTGNLGLLRRLGLESVHTFFQKILKKSDSTGIIPWKDILYVEEKDPLMLKTTQEKISRLPPADIASILNDLDRMTGQSLLEKMDDETLADTLEESPARTQIEVLSTMDSERAADILEEMEPDEAADLLASLPVETTTELLNLMEKDDADDLRVLLDFPPDSAGGIMTTEYAWIPKGLHVDEAIAFLRSSTEAQEVEDMYYIYILDVEKTLEGVIYLRDLVMADPDQEIDELMDASPIYVNPFTTQQETAYLAAKYNLLSIPVVDLESKTMLGIVTLDDALDAVLPTAYKKRLPRFF